MVEPPERAPLAPRSDPPVVVRSGREAISAELALTVFRQMLRARALEERSVKMSKSGEAYFWIGGPGEEAFNVCLGMQVRVGEGPAFDYLHLHYRNSATMLALGMPMLDHFRQVAMAVTDPFSRGRNFSGHYARREWNVVPVSSVIEVQYAMAPGTALVQKRANSEGVTVVTGGESGTAEGDFQSCLIWSSRPGNELPVLMVVTNNRVGISTPHATQHAGPVAGRAAPYGIAHATVDGNDPVAAWHSIDRALRHVRTTRTPYLLEAAVSRLHGHSSSSGAQRQRGEADPVADFERKLVDCGAPRTVRAEAVAEADEAAAQAVSEPKPTATDVTWGTYAPSRVDAIYPDDYTGLPGPSPPSSSSRGATP
jgi:2-oxoisovalerate dehydrogenase E1 component alpha subunit